MSGLSADGGSNAAMDLLSTVKILSDPATFQARLEALQAAQADAENTIALVGPAQQIMQMREDAATQSLDAAKTLADAQSQADFLASTAKKSVTDANEQATSIVKAAQDQAAQMIRDAQNAAQAIQAKTDAQSAALQAASDQAAQVTAQARDRLDQANARYADAEKALADATALQQTFAQKLKAIKDLAG